MESLKILHIENPAGVASQIARAQRTLGHHADVLQTWRGKLDFSPNFEIYYDGNPLTILRNMAKVAGMAKSYDIIHAHTGINWKRWDIVSMRLRRKPIVVHYHGSETRMGYGMSYRRFVPKVKIVATPDLLLWHPKAEFIPNPYASKTGLVSWPEQKKLKLIHAPTNRHLKGTEKVLRAIEMLQEKGMAFDFKLLEDISHDELLREMGRSHIVIDQISDERETGIPGLFGVISLEAMSMGRMSIAYLSPEAAHAYDSSLPIVSPRAPTAKALAQILQRYLTDPRSVRQTGEAGVRYVKEFHDPIEIAKRHIEIYEKVLS